MKPCTVMIAAGLLAAAAAFASGPAVAQQKMVLKASDVHPDGYPTVAAVDSMGKKLEAATNGRLSVQMYPSMQLGGEKEAIEQAQVGAIAFARVSVGALGSGGRRTQRVQSSLPVPQHRAHAESDRRTDRSGVA